MNNKLKKGLIIFSTLVILMVGCYFGYKAIYDNTRIMDYEDSSEFIKLIYDYEIGKKHYGTYLDLRSKENYVLGHIYGSINVDVSAKDKESIADWFRTTYPSTKTVILIGLLDDVETMSNWLFEATNLKIYRYLGDYQELKDDPIFGTYLEEITGEDPCNC